PKRVTAPTSEAPPPAATEEILEDVIEDVIEEEHSSAEQAAPVEEALPDPQPRAAPAKAAPKPTTPRTPSVQRPVEEEKGPPASRPGYQKPPDLVTKW
ncbi:MAG TPA: hypothetical protein VFG22_04105, partial [Polyangiales bacterium]|nr:hypothetical protein [Polyangiales bacterium]